MRLGPLIRLALVLAAVVLPVDRLSASESQKSMTPSAYDFTFRALTGGGEVNLADYRGRVVMVVNTASKCGFTGQYEGLQEIYNEYKGQGFAIIGVPSNDFGAQEPGSSDEIAEFCKLNYGVTFPMTTKESVTGDKAHPFFVWARESSGSAPRWNFHKYLIGRDGQVADSFGSMTAPDSRKVRKSIDNQIEKPFQ